MCCITIETDVLVANFFGSPECRFTGMDGVEVEKIEKCAKVLANNLPVYVFYDLSLKKINELTKENHDFLLSEGKIYYRGKKINRDQYNNIYSASISEKIGRIIDGFFRLRLYDKEIKILMPIRA